MKDDKLYLIHIAESIIKLKAYMAGLDFSTFIEKIMVQDAVLRNQLHRGQRTLPSGMM